VVSVCCLGQLHTHPEVSTTPAPILLMRSYDQRVAPPLALCLADTARPDGHPGVCITLGGTVRVPWPMPDFPPVL